MNPAWDILQGDSTEVMRGMEPESVHCVVTSPPYWGLRNYGVDGAYGLEPTLDEYIYQHGRSVPRSSEGSAEGRESLAESGGCVLLVAGPKGDKRYPGNLIPSMVGAMGVLMDLTGRP